MPYAIAVVKLKIFTIDIVNSIPKYLECFN